MRQIWYDWRKKEKISGIRYFQQKKKKKLMSEKFENSSNFIEAAKNKVFQVFLVLKRLNFLHLTIFDLNFLELTSNIKNSKTLSIFSSPFGCFCVNNFTHSTSYLNLSFFGRIFMPQIFLSKPQIQLWNKAFSEYGVTISRNLSWNTLLIKTSYNYPCPRFNEPIWLYRCSNVRLR